LELLHAAKETKDCRRFWFEKELLNPELFCNALARRLGGLSNRYVPDLVDEGRAFRISG
jgi:hypothetical protein